MKCSGNIGPHHIPTLHELLAVLMLVRLETCWFYMKWAKLDRILHLEMLPICGSFKNVLSSERVRLSRIAHYPVLPFFLSLLTLHAVISILLCCMQSTWLYAEKGFPLCGMKQNFNFCYYKTQLWFPQLGIQYWCNWSEKAPVIWCDMKLFTYSLHIPSNLIKIFFFILRKRKNTLSYAVLLYFL